MCREVGSTTQVNMRREVADVHEVLGIFFCKGGRIDGFLSGSRREGFRFEYSDKDLMIWLPNNKLISDLSQIILYRIPQHTVILMEWEDLPPGFTRLKLMTPTSNRAMHEVCIKIDNELYNSIARHNLQLKKTTFLYHQNNMVRVKFSIFLVKLLTLHFVSDHTIGQR